MSRVPELKFEIPYLLVKRFSPQLSEKEFRNFVRLVKKFEKILAEKQEKILKTIAELLGLKWKEKDIVIYPLPEKAKFPSIAFPLILKIREDMNFNLYILTHELCHRFVESSKELSEFSVKKSRLKGEAFVEFLTLEVLKRILGENKTKRLYEKEKQIVTTRNMQKTSKLVEKFRRKYDLDKKPCIDWLKKRG
jgi:hypothetical protein